MEKELARFFGCGRLGIDSWFIPELTYDEERSSESFSKQSFSKARRTHQPIVVDKKEGL